MSKILSFFIILLLALPAFALTVDVPLNNVGQEERAKSLFREIRCIVCQSETIADSHAEVAKDIRRNIRQWIEQGVGEEEIKTKLASQYGNVILMKPPLNESTILLWVTPWLVLVMGGVAIYFYFRSNNSQKKS